MPIFMVVEDAEQLLQAPMSSNFTTGPSISEILQSPPSLFRYGRSSSRTSSNGQSLFGGFFKDSSFHCDDTWTQMMTNEAKWWQQIQGFPKSEPTISASWTLSQVNGSFGFCSGFGSVVSASFSGAASSTWVPWPNSYDQKIPQFIDNKWQ